MAFALADQTLAAWAAAGLSPATEVEIAEIQALARGDLPVDYRAFLQTHGFAHWDPDGACQFALGDREGDISGMLRAENISWCLDDCPAGFLPIAGDYGGHALILLALTGARGSIWYQEDADDPVQVAPDLRRFLADLRPPDPGPRFERWGGTPVTDPVSGFTLARETRAAWAAYGTGSEPEPEEELEAIEAALGRPLPQALRRFLSTYGYVTFFGDALATFDLPEGGRSGAG